MFWSRLKRVSFFLLKEFKMKSKRAIDIFEALKDIKDSKKFERERSRFIKEFLAGIEDSDKRQMLEATQFAIDRERKKYKHPLVCAERIYQLMLRRGLFRLNNALKDFQEGKVREKAPLIPFNKK
jgi:hypothetical protein